MYEPYDYDETIDEDDGFHTKRRFRPKEDIISASRGGGLKKSSRWVFISRKADIGIILVLFLGAGLGIMWFISQLPVFVETASNHYYWARDVYVTWGTPSMRWLFINLVVGVIVATSGLLSAFGGDGSSQQTDRSTSGYDKGVSYRGPEPGVIYGGSDPAYNASTARFTGPGYESPHYNPYVNEQQEKDRIHHEASFEAWNHADDAHSDGREREAGFHRGMHGPPVNEPPFARPVDPEVMRAARPVSRQGSQRRGIPIPAEDLAPLPRDLPREMFDTPRGDMPRGEVPMSREISREMPPRESFMEVSREMPPMEEPAPPSETSESREIPASVPVAEEVPPPPEPAPPEPQVSEGSYSSGASRKEDAIEIISKVYDPIPSPTPAIEGVETDHKKFRRLKTDPGMDLAAPVGEVSGGSSPARPEALNKSHTFTIGRVIRRDQFADFIEPLSRKLEGIGRKVSLKSLHLESGNQSRELPGPLPPALGSNSLPAAIEAGNSAPQPGKHGRRLSSEAIPAIAHNRRLSSESVPSAESNLPKMTPAPPVIPNKFPSIVPKPSPPSPSLRQRSIVYPPALLSQASIAAAAAEVEAELSPPSSPPIEEAVPPPPPPHLKLPPARHGASSASMLASEELPSFKFQLPPTDSPDVSPAVKPSQKQVEKFSSSDDSKKPPSGKHSRKNSSIPSTSSGSTLEAGGSSSGADERSLKGKPLKSNAGDEKGQEIKEEPPVDRQEASSAKDDDLHQQIEDFLARFHENWRLQRQESLNRYKKRLSELDDE